MQESMVKFLLILIALVSLAFGALLLIIPGWYITFSEGETVNIAWLRAIGAGLVSLQGIGLVVAAIRRRDTNPLLGFIALTSSLQIGVLWYSLIVEEYTAEAMWTIIVPGILATAGVIILWIAWVSRRASLKALAGVHGRTPAPEPPPPSPERDESHRAPPHEFD